MPTVKVKKLHPDAKLPTKGTKDAACFDLYAVKDMNLPYNTVIRVSTGLAFEIPAGYCGVVYSRSSSFLKGMIITPLVVDSDYRGEVFVSVRWSDIEKTHYELKAGDRIAQIRIERLVSTKFVEAEELSETARGTGGYGSTGR
jgi:dUTP pyrophosphatase